MMPPMPPMGGAGPGAGGPPPMPGGMPPMGGAGGPHPPGPPGGTGGAMAPGPMAGSAAQGMIGLKLSVEMLQKHLNAFPPGSEVHADILKAITNLSKHLDHGSNDPAAMIQQIVGMARSQQNDPQKAALMRGLPPSPAGPGAPPPAGPPA